MIDFNYNSARLILMQLGKSWQSQSNFYNIYTFI